MSLMDTYRKLFANSHLRISLRELAEASGVSPSQIRYWERKGYIQSEQSQENGSHKYRLPMMGRVLGIKFFLDQGYTLPVAVEKQRAQQDLLAAYRRFIVDRVKEVHRAGPNQAVVNLGTLTDDPATRVVALVNREGPVELRLLPVAPDQGAASD